MKLVINNKLSTITVYGNYEVDEVMDEIECAGLIPAEWTIQIIPSHYWTQNISYPHFFNDYEIKA